MQAPGAETAAAILAERFALPESTGMGVRISLPDTLSSLGPLAFALASQKWRSKRSLVQCSGCILLCFSFPDLSRHWTCFSGAVSILQQKRGSRVTCRQREH